MPVVYQPKGKAHEYAPLACNVYRGCDHACTYCYAPSATYRTHEAFGVPELRSNFLAQLEKDAKKLWQSRNRSPVLLSFTCDPYQSFDIEHQVTRQTIKILHNRGISMQVLTKGGSRALRDLDLFTSADAFASTLTCLEESKSTEWEPGAATPADRIYTLHQFYQASIQTWVSLEPVLDPAVAIEIVEETHSFVHLFKVGKINYHPLSKSIDWRSFGLQIIDTLESLSQPYYIKDDLLNHLPAEALGPCHITVAELEHNFSAQSLRLQSAIPTAHTPQMSFLNL